MEPRVRNVWQGAMTLGEGPVWDPRAQLLWFVDIKGRRVHRQDPATEAVSSWQAPAPVGWVLPAEGGVLLAGLQSGLAVFDPTIGTFTSLLAVEPDQPGNRLNDATVAPDGAVWFGSMDDAEHQPSGRFYRFDGRTATAAAIPPVAITNGPAVSSDGRVIYHVDTAGGIIHAAALHPDGTVGPSRVFTAIDPVDGHPDGVTVDAEGHVWVGLWDGWCARRYAPDGTQVGEVRLPAANVTKITLGGPDLRTAYVTTARIGLDEAALAQQPEAGALFSFRVDVPGQALPLARLGR